MKQRHIKLGLSIGICFLFMVTGAAWVSAWEGAAHVGLTATDGNSQTSNTNASIEAQKKEAVYILRTAASTTYGRTEGKTSTDKSSAVAQYNRFITERLSGYLNIGGDRDRIADLLWRLQVGPGVGYFFIKSPKASLSGDLGVTFFREKFENTEIDDYFALRVAERGERKISDNANAWEMVEYLPAFNHFKDKYLLKAETGVEAAITTRTNLRLLIQDIYNNTPAAGKKRNDITYIAAVGFKF